MPPDPPSQCGPRSHICALRKTSRRPAPLIKNIFLRLCGVVFSQLVRYLRICCNYQHFAYRSKLLTTRLLRQGYVYQKLCRTYKTFVHRYPKTLQKYRRCLKNIITECIASPTVVSSPRHPIFRARPAALTKPQGAREKLDVWGRDYTYSA